MCILVYENYKLIFEGEAEDFLFSNYSEELEDVLYNMEITNRQTVRYDEYLIERGVYNED